MHAIVHVYVFQIHLSLKRVISLPSVLSVIIAANLVGLDVTGLKKLCAVLGIDGLPAPLPAPPPPPDSYHSLYQDELHTELNQIMTNTQVD